VVPRDNEKNCGGFMVSINSRLSGEQTARRQAKQNRLPLPHLLSFEFLISIRGQATDTAADLVASPHIGCLSSQLIWEHSYFLL